MLKPADLPDVVPVFPLPGALLLPRARLPLHIFEPRYLAMLTDCMKTGHRLIGMVQPRGVPEGAAPKLHAIGCAGRLTGFSETEARGIFKVPKPEHCAGLNIRLRPPAEARKAYLDRFNALIATI